MGLFLTHAPSLFFGYVFHRPFKVYQLSDTSNRENARNILQFLLSVRNIKITDLCIHYKDRIFRHLRHRSGFQSSLFLIETVWNSCVCCDRIFRLESSIRQTVFHWRKYFRKTGQRTAAVPVHHWDLRDCSRCMVPHSR